MRKAMGFLCLLPVMFAFGAPHANAASCDMLITAKNESGASATLKQVRGKRKSESWVDFFNGNTSMGSSQFIYRQSVPHGSCSKNHEVWVAFRCANNNNDTTKIYLDLTTNNPPLTKNVILTTSDCQWFDWSTSLGGHGWDMGSDQCNQLNFNTIFVLKGYSWS